jgi:hypothetical protein
MMKRALLCGGVNGDRRGIEALRRFAADRRPEAVLFAGGILSPQRQTAPFASSPWGITPEDERFLHEFAGALGGLGVLCAVIPSANYQPMDQFYLWEPPSRWSTRWSTWRTRRWRKSKTWRCAGWG